MTGTDSVYENPRPHQGLFLADLPSAEWVQYVRYLEAAEAALRDIAGRPRWVQASPLIDQARVVLADLALIEGRA